MYWCFSEGRIVMIRFGWVRVPGPLLPCADGRKYAEMISPQSCGAEMHQGGFGSSAKEASDARKITGPRLRTTHPAGPRTDAGV